MPAYGQEAQEVETQKKAEPTDAKKLVADFSKLKHTKSGRIDKIIDGLTFILKDGTIVRLASLDIPDFYIVGDAPYAAAAMELLQDKLSEQTEVMLYQTRDAKKGRVNRMNHQLAHVAIKKDKTWIQGEFLRHGLARVYTAPNKTEMLTQMYAVEAATRDKKIGLWEEGSLYQVLSHNQAENKIGKFVVIEGEVKKVASVRNQLYLNFGDNWKIDFTIQVSTGLRKQFAREGIDVMSLAQQKIRVRGYLREYNGPLIELEDTAHLEVLR